VGSCNGQATGKIISGRRTGLWTSYKNECEEQGLVKRKRLNVNSFGGKAFESSTFHFSRLTFYGSLGCREGRRVEYSEPDRSDGLEVIPYFLHVGFKGIRHGEGSQSAQLEDRPVDHV